MGVAHGDDLQYILQSVWGEENTMSSSDNKFTKNVYAPLLTNFAKTRYVHGQRCKLHFAYDLNTGKVTLLLLFVGEGRGQLLEAIREKRTCF
jgi:hypothetical protein